MNELSLREFDAIFGYDIGNMNDFVNRIILYGKDYVLHCKYNCNDIDYDDFLTYLKHRYDITL